MTGVAAASGPDARDRPVATSIHSATGRARASAARSGATAIEQLQQRRRSNGLRHRVGRDRVHEVAPVHHRLDAACDEIVRHGDGALEGLDRRTEVSREHRHAGALDGNAQVELVPRRTLAGGGVDQLSDTPWFRRGSRQLGPPAPHRTPTRGSGAGGRAGRRGVPAPPGSASRRRRRLQLIRARRRRSDPTAGSAPRVGIHRDPPPCSAHFRARDGTPRRHPSVVLRGSGAPRSRRWATGNGR